MVIGYISINLPYSWIVAFDPVYAKDATEGVN